MPIMTFIKLAISNWQYIAIAVLSGLLWSKDIQLQQSELNYKELVLQYEQAAKDSEVEGAKSGAEATEGLLSDEENSADAVTGVLDDIDGLHQDNNCEEVSRSSLVDEREANDSQDRLRRVEANWRVADERATRSLQLVENIKHDLKYCNTQLNKSYRRIEWMEDNGAFDKPG